MREIYYVTRTHTGSGSSLDGVFGLVFSKSTLFSPTSRALCVEKVSKISDDDDGIAVLWED